MLAFLFGSHGLDIEVRFGRAFGFSEKTYPFNQDRARIGGLEPLLLPWGGTGIARYHWDGSGYAR